MNDKHKKSATVLWKHAAESVLISVFIVFSTVILYFGDFIKSRDF